tara:strand:- start:247 stop:654 length:408 start_codon:yes stop_codon:yes gene_type:complete
MKIVNKFDKALKNKICIINRTIMSDNKIMEQASNAIINGLRATIDELQKKVENLEQFDNQLADERLDEIIKLEGKVKQLRETNDELCFENDEINRKWAEDRERDGDILSEQQNQILALEEENEKLKEQLNQINQN